MTNKALLIGLDGATFSVLDPFMERGVMPFLHDFTEQGSRAPLRSIVPHLTPPAWTSLMTGLRPGRHGVFDFFQKEAPDSRYFGLATSRHIHAETIWTLADAHGLRVIALNFPMTFPPPKVAGCVVPGGWMPWRQLRLGCHPRDLFDRIKELPEFNARELALDMALEEKALEGCDVEEYADWVTLHMRRDRQWFDILDHLMCEEPAALTAVMFDSVDKLQHLCWRFIDPTCRPPEPTPWEQEILDLCESYFRQLDGLIERIVERAGPETTVVLASDHGFAASSDIFHVNTWLEREGYLAWSEDDASAKSDGDDRLLVGIGHIARHNVEMDWSRTIAYAPTPSSQGIHIVRQGPDGGPGVPVGSYDRVRDEIARGLKRLRHPETGRPIVAEVWARDEVFSGPYAELGPDLTLLLEDHGVLSILRSRDIVKRRPVPVGTHHPIGILLARGPAIRAGFEAPEVSLPDVAPLLLHAIDTPIPDGLDGRLPVEMFEPHALRCRPPRLLGGPSSPHQEPFGDIGEVEPDLVYGPDEEEIVLRRLKALGYVE